MNFIINKESNLQISEQIIAQIKYQIINGELEQDSRLPSVRELASMLNVNRHTVLKAYKELENEGLIVTKQSLGTYVNKDIEVPQKNDMEKLMNTIKEAMEAANLLGFTSREFLAMAEIVYLKEKENMRVKGLFVECNDIALKHYICDITEKLDIDVDGCLLDDLDENEIGDYDLIMTTFAHYPQLKKALKKHSNLYALNFSPFLKVLNEIMELPKDTNVGIVCLTDMGTAALEQMLTDLGVVQGSILQTDTEDLDKVKELAEKVDVLIVSKYALEANPEFFNLLPKKIIEYKNVLQGSSVRMLQEIISQVKQSKKNASCNFD
ncbi:MAG TPA: GntR family transcriptional regulator [Sedimentibacter sp.]|nr:GntR family transcriptional regulator [Sedimentibacter sp.]